MQTFSDGREAVKAWREDGGAMNYGGGEVWWVGTAEEIAEMVQDQDTARGATVGALVAAGLSDAEINHLMRDWTDPEAETQEDRRRALDKAKSNLAKLEAMTDQQ